MTYSFNISWRWTDIDRNKIFKIIQDFQHPIYHICSGTSNIGDIRCDAKKINIKTGDEGRKRKKYTGNCNVLGDMTKLPFKDCVAGSIICDPPYDYNFTNPELINELTRILKPSGKMLFISPWVPKNKDITLIDTDLWIVGIERPYYKIRTLFYKSNAQLSDFMR